MADYGKEMAEYAKNNVHVDIRNDRREENRNERTIERSIERSLERSAEARARGAEERAKAAEVRAKAAEIRAKERAKAAEIRAKEAVIRNERMEKLKAELRKDKLIGENDINFVYRISKDGLIVNNKKQPQATFEKYKKLFHQGSENSSTFSEVYVITDDGKSRKVTISNTSDNAAKDKNKTKEIKVKAKTDKKN